MTDRFSGKYYLRVKTVVLNSCIFALYFFSCVIIANAATKIESYSWTANKVKCYVAPGIKSKYGATLHNAIVSGLKNWNTTDAPTITTNTTSKTSPITVKLSNYGATGWDGNTSVTFIGKEIQTAQIALNNHYLKDYISDNGLWKALSTHEMGHALGLGHNTTDSQKSILKTHTVMYYDYASNSPHITEPTKPDKKAINKKY